MNIKLCDLCLKEGKISILHPIDWQSWHWSHSTARTIHFCHSHNISFLKNQIYEDYRKMVQEIDDKASNLLKW